MAKRNKILSAMLDGVGNLPGVTRMHAPSRAAVSVECPRKGEVVARPEYSFHVSAAAGVTGVEISIDQGDWLTCRESLGLWWYDWSHFAEGEHEVVARARIADGISVSSTPRSFTVA